MWILINNVASSYVYISESDVYISFTYMPVLSRKDMYIFRKCVGLPKLLLRTAVHTYPKVRFCMHAWQCHRNKTPEFVFHRSICSSCMHIRTFSNVCVVYKSRMHLFYNEFVNFVYTYINFQTQSSVSLRRICYNLYVSI